MIKRRLHVDVKLAFLAICISCQYTNLRICCYTHGTKHDKMNVLWSLRLIKHCNNLHSELMKKMATKKYEVR